MRIDERIHSETELRVAECAAGGKRAIERRLAEIDRERDVDETFMLGGAIATFAGLTLSIAVHRRFIVIPAVAAGFFATRVLFGWAPPPVRLMRLLGIRTREEIENERYALKALHGDFRDLPVALEPGAGSSTSRALRATEPRPRVGS